MPRTKKPKICPFSIIIDTREQAPFSFDSIEQFDIVNVESRALRTGDYSIAGLEDAVSIERKSVADFYGSIGQGRERFEREMQRLALFRYAAVVIEGGWSDILFDRPENVLVPARAASNTILSWSIRYGVHFWLCDSRRQAELTTFALLRHFWKQDQELQKLEFSDAEETSVGATPAAKNADSFFEDILKDSI